MKLSLALAVALVALIFSFCHAMLGFDLNENMYVTAGVLISQGHSIYRDFAYLQAPYLAELYGLLFGISGTTYHLFVARILNWCFWVAGAVLTGFITKHITRDRGFSFAAGLMYVVNPLMLRITIEASNYVLPATLALLQVLFVLKAFDARRYVAQASFLFLAGLMAGLSVGTKAYFLAAAAPFFVLPWLCRGDRSRVAITAPMLFGFALALAPAAFIFARDPWLFLFNNFHYHRLATAKAWLLHLDADAPMTWNGKMTYLCVTFLGSACVMLLIVIAVARILVRKNQTAATPSLNVTRGALLLTLIAVALMTPLHPQYLAMPVPYMILFASCLYAALPPRDRGLLRKATFIATGVSAVMAIDIHEVRASIDRTPWRPTAIEATSQSIRLAMERAGVSGKVATLQPLLATEAGLPIYREFASGPFMFFVSDLMGPEARRHAIGAGAADLETLFGADPPAAIVVTQGSLDDRTLERYAVGHHYREVHVAADFPARLYLKQK